MTGERGHQGGGVGRAKAGDRIPAGGRRVTGDGRVELVSAVADRITRH